MNTGTLTTEEFADYIQHQEQSPQLQNYCEVICDFNNEKHTLEEWLIILLTMLDDQIDKFLNDPIPYTIKYLERKDK